MTRSQKHLKSGVKDGGGIKLTNISPCGGGMNVFFEGGDYLLHKMGPDIGEYSDDDFSGCWPILRKRYLEMDVKVHLHIRMRSRVAPSNTTELCLVLERAEPNVATPNLNTVHLSTRT